MVNARRLAVLEVTAIPDAQSDFIATFLTSLDDKADDSSGLMNRNERTPFDTNSKTMDIIGAEIGRLKVQEF